MRKILTLLFLLVSLSVFPRTIFATYFKEDGRWYWGATSGTEVVGAHTRTFHIIYNGRSRTSFARDRRSIYFAGQRIEGVHRRTWELIIPTLTGQYEIVYSRDRRNIFFGSEKIVGADRDSFEDITNAGWRATRWGRDKNSIFRGAVRTSYDVATFQELCSWRGFTADKSGVYYQDRLLEGSCFDDFRILNLYIISNNRIFFNDHKLNADAESFQILGYRHIPIAGAAGFELTIASDKNHIFVDSKKITELDVETFEIVDLDYQLGRIRGGPIVRDKNGTFQIRYYWQPGVFSLIPIETE
jgi:hypothetical protein